MQNEQRHAGAEQDASGHLEPLARPEALTEMVTERLRSAILSGTLAPGTHLSVPEIAKRLGVSRTPAREGLIALEREGLVEPRASAGVAVIAGGTADILDLLDIREGLEIITVRRAAERMDGEGIAQLKALFAQHEAVVAQNDLARHVELDAAFHGMIRDGAGNGRLARQLVQIDQQLRVLNSRLSRAQGWSGRAVLRDHKAIIDAIEAGNADAAERHMRAHIERTRAFQQRSAGQDQPPT
ncbi:GntR family transcriptional regulator [Sphingobium chungbukense]|uniref:GntR family transcriptional regulator n=1 Tax=Sphingobium chungbukense TaxID=56193 RepID=A0A0M3AT14_9SPHN|nr:GntR family transcriptional regulator [Sphingobium chungbukense]KKW92081.1 GntR family transcriptional regulator [Sphingobium chungbukense]